MKKLIAILMVTLGVSSLLADDSYLYWWVSDYGDYSGQWNTGWSNARIHATNGSGEDMYLNLYSGDISGGLTPASPNATTLTGVNSGDGSMDTTFWANVTAAGAGWTYFLEVYNSDNGWNGMSSGLTYESASSYIATTSGDIHIPGAAFDFGMLQYSAVPEPNSAMLLLLGLSALALRRKQKKA